MGSVTNLPVFGAFNLIVLFFLQPISLDNTAVTNDFDSYYLHLLPGKIEEKICFFLNFLSKVVRILCTQTSIVVKKSLTKWLNFLSHAYIDVHFEYTIQ